MAELRIQIPLDDAVLFDRQQSWEKFQRWLIELREICREHLSPHEAAAVASCRSQLEVALWLVSQGRTTMAKVYAANLFFRLRLIDLAFKEKTHVGAAVSVADAAEVLRRWIEFSSRRDKATAARLIDANRRRLGPLTEQTRMNRNASAAWWQPHKSQFRKLVDSGFTVLDARRCVADAIYESGIWPHGDGPSERVLRSRLK
jgi:hypothetical protein